MGESGWGGLKTRNETENGSNHKLIIYIGWGVLFEKRKEKEESALHWTWSKIVKGDRGVGTRIRSVIGGKKENSHLAEER